MKIRFRFAPLKPARSNVRVAAALLGAAAIGGGIAILRAQSAAETTFKAQAQQVLVDAVAFDRKGNFARDLTEKDFKVYEDGKEQQIASFSLESASLSPERSTKHFIAIMFDSASMAAPGEQRAREEAIRFVDSSATPDRYMAVIDHPVVGLDFKQNFTPNAARIKAALETLHSTSALTSPRELLEAIDDAAKTMAPIRGRKALILFSAGFAAAGDATGEIQDTLDICNRANVAVYSIPIGAATSANSGRGGLTGGGGGRGGRNAARGADSASGNENVLRLLSDGTGGVWMPPLTNDLAAYLGNIVQEQDDYYLLGYTPAADSVDGACHKLKVKVDRGGLDVRSRESYCTSSPAIVVAGKPIEKALEAWASGAAANNAAATLQLPWFYTKPNVAQVGIAMDIDPSAVKFQKVKGKLHGEFDLAGVAYRPDGTVAARVGDSVKLDFDTQEEVDAFLKKPYHYANQFEIAPGKYDFRMAAGSGDRGFAKAEMPLNVDAWNGQKLSVSGLALSTDAHPLTGLAASLDESQLEGPRVLATKGMEVVPMGTTQFHAGDKGLFYVEVYEPLLAGQPKTAPPVSLEVRILDRASGQQKEDSGVMSAIPWMRAGNPIVPIALGLPTAALPAGEYRLEVRVMHEKGQDALTRNADFDIK